jgi:hypothetical protein
MVEIGSNPTLPTINILTGGCFHFGNNHFIKHGNFMTKKAIEYKLKTMEGTIVYMTIEGRNKKTPNIIYEIFVENANKDIFMVSLYSMESVQTFEDFWWPRMSDAIGEKMSFTAHVKNTPSIMDALNLIFNDSIETDEANKFEMKLL